MNEPSVLDFLKGKLFPRKYPHFPWPSEQAAESQASDLPAQDQEEDAGHISLEPSSQGSIGLSGASLATPAPSAKKAVRPAAAVWPWRTLLAVGLALIAQRGLEPSTDRTWTLSIVFYLLSGLSLIWSIWQGEWRTAAIPSPAFETATADERHVPLAARSYPFILALIFGLGAFAAFGGNQFNLVNVSLWLAAIYFLVYAFWPTSTSAASWLQKFKSLLTRPRWDISISRWTLLLLLAAALIIFFRAHRLGDVPPEMNSDHAEKLLDVMDVLHGQTRIFFPRNTGREAFQFYLTAAIISLFHTGISFLSLKIGTMLAGLVALPFIYLLGKEVGNRETGLWALLFAGIAYWPNVISRIALRFTLYPMAAAPMLYFIVRGLKRSSRKDFIWAGIALGIGLHGYSPARILPFIAVALVLIYVIHEESTGKRKQALLHLGLLALVSLFVFLPLLRYTVSNPDMVMYRSLTRLGDLERPLPGPAWQIFLENLWKAWIMLFWNDGEVWLHSIPYRPALSVVAAALYFLGSLTVLFRYLLRRHWLDLLLLLSVPLLMLPSILSLAFPGENPSLNRTGAAIIPVFILTGIAVQSLMASLRSHLGPVSSSRTAWAVALFLLLLSALQDYDLVFRQYYRQYQLSSWNTSELGDVIHAFVDSGGSPDSAWVVPYPYWVDTRLVGIQAGYPGKDYAIPLESLDSTRELPGPKLFLLKPEDNGALIKLRSLYPRGWVKEFVSKVETKDFLIYTVPPD